MSDIAIEVLETEIARLRSQLIALQTIAKHVANIRYSDTEWDELNNAIGEMIDVLDAQGIKFNNPRIHQRG